MMESGAGEKVVLVDEQGRPVGVEEKLAAHQDGGRLHLAFNQTGPTGQVTAESLELRIEDGNDAPLTFTAVAVQTPQIDLYFAAPAGDYSLLLGNPDAEPPRYEIEQIRNLILAVPAGTTESDDLEPNPAYSHFTRARGRGTAQQVLLWVALVGAVLVLTVVTLRLARGTS